MKRLGILVTFVITLVVAPTVQAESDQEFRFFRVYEEARKTLPQAFNPTSASGLYRSTIYQTIYQTGLDYCAARKAGESDFSHSVNVLSRYRYSSLKVQFAIRETLIASVVAAQVEICPELVEPIKKVKVRGL